MKVKALEIRDRGTFMPVLAIKIEADNPSQYYLINRAGCPGHPHNSIILYLLSKDSGQMDFYNYGDRFARTVPIAHEYIYNNFDILNDGDVVDVEFILGETNKIKLSEKITVDLT